MECAQFFRVAWRINMVESVAATVDAILAQGGQVVQSIGADTPEVARFHDPAGNVFGLWEELGRGPPKY
jgi:predicted enzyme related to lactoylglutathione lyase